MSNSDSGLADVQVALEFVENDPATLSAVLDVLLERFCSAELWDSQLNRRIAFALKRAGWSPSGSVERCFNSLALDDPIQNCLPLPACLTILERIRTGGGLPKTSLCIIRQLSASRDVRAIDPLLRFLLALGPELDGNPIRLRDELAAALRALTVVSKLTDDLILTLVSAADAGTLGDFDEGGWQRIVRRPDGAVAAVGSLCAKDTALTSNFLHLIAHKPDLHPEIRTRIYQPWDSERERSMARDELLRRGNPEYRPGAYRGA